MLLLEQLVSLIYRQTCYDPYHLISYHGNVISRDLSRELFIAVYRSKTLDTEFLFCIVFAMKL